MPRYFTHCDDIDIAAERAEEAADARQDALDAEIRSAGLTLSPIEQQAADMKAYEDRERLKGLPIGTTMDSARRKGWLEPGE